MLVSGTTISHTARVSTYGLKFRRKLFSARPVTCTVVLSRMVNDVDLEPFFMQMVLSTWENGWIILSTDKDVSFIPTGEFIMEILKWTV